MFAKSIERPVWQQRSMCLCASIYVCMYVYLCLYFAVFASCGLDFHVPARGSAKWINLTCRWHIFGCCPNVLGTWFPVRICLPVYGSRSKQTVERANGTRIEQNTLLCKQLGTHTHIYTQTKKKGTKTKKIRERNDISYSYVCCLTNICIYIWRLLKQFKYEMKLKGAKHFVASCGCFFRWMQLVNGFLDTVSSIYV